jgi:arginyl-tRNA synthetase
MTTLTIPELEAHLAGLGVKIPIPQFQAADVNNKPLDIARVYLADILSSLAECDLDVAYKSIYWPNNIFNGDLVVILPKLSRDADPKAVALSLTEKVGIFFCLLVYCYRDLTSSVIFSSSNARFLSFLFKMEFTFASRSAHRHFLVFYFHI